MKLLEERILKDGSVKDGGILKVDSFLNHQVDVNLMDEMGKEFHRLFRDANINKVLTIETSGIAIAEAVAREFNVPLVFAKKSLSVNLDGEMYEVRIESFTHKRVYNVIVSKKFLGKGDRVLVIDDFLANGKAVEGLLNIIEQSGAELCGVGIAIEKGFQAGGKLLRDMGVRLESLAIVEHMDPETGIVFREQ